MEWKQLAARLAQLGLPVLGKAVGTLVGAQVPIVGGMIAGAGENIGAAAAQMIANALGVEPDPVAISEAIGTQPAPDVMAKMQATEAEAAAKWAALAQIAQAEEATAQTQITTTAESMKQEILASSQLPEGKVRFILETLNTAWRPLFAIELLAECLYFFFGFTSVLLAGFIKNDYGDIDAMIKLMPLITVLLLPYLAARFGILGYHMNLRTQEKADVVEAVTEKPSISLDDVKKLLRASGVRVK